MKIIITMFTSSAVFWGIIIAAVICSRAVRKNKPPSVGTEVNDRYSDVCTVCNIICFYVIFELFSFLTAYFINSIMLTVVLHIAAWLAGGYLVQNVISAAVNEAVGKIIGK